MDDVKSPEKSSFVDLLPDVEIPKEFFWEGTFFEYIDRVLNYPRLVRTAHERVYDMTGFYGEHVYTLPWHRESIVHYNLFDDPFNENHGNAMYGIDLNLMDFVGVIQAGSFDLGTQDRIILAEGPVGSAKSTLGELLASGLEHYTTTNDGAYFATFWVVGEDSDGIVSKEQGAQVLGIVDQLQNNGKTPYRFDCQMHEQPFRIIPKKPVNIRDLFLQNINGVLENRYKSMSSTQMRDFLKTPKSREVMPHFLKLKSVACPRCNDIFWDLVKLYKGDWKKVLTNHLRVKRVLMSREQRIGIAITRPKSEKDQDSTEWSGETNYVALGKFGSPLDPKTFDFKGYFEVAEGGILYSEELLKLSQTFLYDYLGASQEHRIQPKGFMEVDIDVVIIGGTNEPEYLKLKENKEMQALKDRIVRVSIPYVDNYLEEAKIYLKSFNSKNIKGRHLAPFTIELVSFFAVMTRSAEVSKVSMRNKVKLYAGKNVEGFNDDSVREMKREARGKEFKDGASPRFILDQISGAFINTFVSHGGREKTNCVTPFAVLREVEDNLPDHLTEDQKKRWRTLLEQTREELDHVLKSMFQEIIVGDKEALEEIHHKYIDNLMALKEDRKIFDETRGEVSADKTFLESIEAKVGKTEESSREQFRAKIISAMARREIERQRDPNISGFHFDSDEVLFRAYKDFLFEQQQKNIDWQALVSKKAVGDQAKRKIAEIKRGLEDHGCCHTCASAFITHVAGIFTRGKSK